jgi:hypothetical protein
MTDDLRMGLAKAICEAQHIDPDALVMHGFKTMPAWQSRTAVADAAIAHMRAHMARDAVREAIGDAVFDPGKLAGVRGGIETMRQWTARAVITACLRAMGER